MLSNKQIAIGALLISGILGAGYLVSTITATETYECYYWKLYQDKDLIICNYPGTTDMYHSYLTEKDMKAAMISAGATYTYSGKHPSGLNWSDWNRTKTIR